MCGDYLHATNKLARATLPAHFFLASLVAMGREQLVLTEI